MSASASARLTKRSGTHFYYAFRILPEEKRRAIYALYAFCRVVDDCVDEEGGEGEPGLRRWLEEVERCYVGRPQTELGRELAQTVARYPIPRRCFEDVVAGCRMDLRQPRYRRYEDLLVYCKRVASAVGLASIEIFGYRHPAAREYAIELGLALQLTNILRDVGVDYPRGRFYLPAEDLARFGCTEDDIRQEIAHAGHGVRADKVRALLDHQAARARVFFSRAVRALPKGDARRFVAAEIMREIYWALLKRIEAAQFDVFTEVVRIPRPAQARLALRTWWRLRR
jgi:phytoene synthase